MPGSTPASKMSKTTLAVIAAVSAGAGAAATAAMYAMRSDRRIDTNAPSAMTTLSTAVQPPTATAPVPISQKISQISSPPTADSPIASAALAAGDAFRHLRVNPAGLFEYGFPGPVSDMGTRRALIFSYDRRLRNPHWVVEHITSESLKQKSGDRQNSAFLEDPIIPDKFRARLKDYFRSGYDRGHQVPAADAKWCQNAMDETFYLTNMCPQVGEGFNRDYWAHFEDFCRRLTGRYPSVRIVTGPLYLPKHDPTTNKWYVKYEMIGNPPNVAVPTHFYKVIFAEDGKQGGQVALGAFVLPNAKIPNDKRLAEFEVPIGMLERASGLEFASKLPAHRRKSLCAETNCCIVVREFNERPKARK